MKPITREWVDKAEADYHASTLLRGSRKKHSREIVCFHLQQCAEKYLKGRLVEAGIEFPKTHDITKLLDLTLQVEPLWATLRAASMKTTDYAVETRSPGRTATPVDAKKVPMATTHIRSFTRASLGLP